MASQVKTLLQEQYEEEVVPQLLEELPVDNVHGVPGVNKVTLNIGISVENKQKQRVEEARKTLATITAQEPVVTNARKAIAGFNIKKGDPVGCKVTLREGKMWAFLERLIHVVIPRIKDFRGLEPGGMDGSGNFAMGISEQAVFPEINVDNFEFHQGMDICITTTARNDSEGLKLLRALGFPFQDES